MQLRCHDSATALMTIAHIHAKVEPEGAAETVAVISEPAYATTMNGVVWVKVFSCPFELMPMATNDPRSEAPNNSVAGSWRTTLTGNEATEMYIPEAWFGEASTGCELESLTI
ncbi:MAG: hypothetical protein WB643_07230 [Candidatus Bathyarchaeia archaeon]